MLNVYKHKRAVQWWLWIGVGMVIVQILLGGITRLTGSGLSITKWEIVTGTIPPLSEDDWLEEFDLYKQTPQYAKINKGMTLSEFKFIYFWEYFHRFWGRLLGFVFLLPFIVFYARGNLDPPLIKRVVGAVLLGGVVGIFGWIMVASGLVNRPWVNAYKLMLHLGLAVVLFGYMVYVSTYYQMRSVRFSSHRLTLPRRTLFWLSIVIFIQILLGALMSGMKAGLFYPTWPTMNGEMVPSVIFNTDNWTLEAFKTYDSDLFVPALVQFFHRGVAYLIFILFAILVWRFRRERLVWYGFGIVCIQIALGIWTLIMCVGQIPLTLGVLHQLVGILLFGYLIVLYTKKCLGTN